MRQRSPTGPTAEPSEPLCLLIDPLARSVVCAGHPLALQDKALDLLLVLASEPGRVFSSRDLTAAVWPGRHVEDQNLRTQVLALRKALGDPQAIVTVPSQGYQLGRPVRWLQPVSQVGRVPAWAEPLLGRDEDLAALKQLLREQRLVTILGTGGIGKTRLAHQLLHDLQAQFPHGVWWLDLSTVRSREPAVSVATLALATAQVMGLPTVALRDASAATKLAEMLAGWRALLLLDNAEHLAVPEGPVATLVNALIGTASGLRLLVTSQLPLRVAGEWLYRLDTLARPKPDAAPVEVLASPATQLLLQRARAADHAWSLPASEVSAAGELTRQLDGIALAIEMAAARLPLLGAPALSQLLQQQLHHLRSDDQTRPERQRTLQATLAWSHGLLSATEQAALGLLSVFAAPFRLTSAQSLLSGLGLDEATTLQTIQSLFDKSMLQRLPGATDGVPQRLRLLQTTRQFAAELLNTQADAWNLSRRCHARAMAEQAQQALADFYRCADDLWMARWLPDHADFALGFDHAHLFRDADSGAKLIEVLVRGSMITGRTDWATQRWAQSRDLADTAAALPRALLLDWGSYQLPAGKTRLELAAERVDRWQALGDTQRQCVALAHLALTCEHAGDRPGADAALQACEVLEDPTWSPRLRLRCAHAVLEGMSRQRDDPVLMQRFQASTQQLVPALRALGAEVSLQAIETQRLPQLCLQGQFDQALEVVQAMTASASSRHLHLAQGVFHGYGMVAWLGKADAQAAAPLRCAATGEHRLPTADAAASPAGPSAGTAASTQALAEATHAAVRALDLLAGGTDNLRLFAAALAWLAFRLGDPVLAATLQACGQRLQQSLQYTADRLEAQFAEKLQATLPGAMDSEALRRAQTEGNRLTMESLREWALQRFVALQPLA